MPWLDQRSLLVVAPCPSCRCLRHHFACQFSEDRVEGHSDGAEGIGAAEATEEVDGAEGVKAMGAGCVLPGSGVVDACNSHTWQ